MNSRIRKSARRLTLLLTPAAYSLITAAPAWAAVGVGVGALWIGVTDGDGVPHVLEYQMIPTPEGWQINGVQLLRAPALGA